MILLLSLQSKFEIQDLITETSEIKYMLNWY